MVVSRHVVLIGLMASGKTSVGQPLAARLGRPFVDNDARLKERSGHSAREIAAAEGADALHRREAEVLVEALGTPEPCVIAAAAAAPLVPTAASALAGHDVVYLRVAPEVLAARLERAPDDGHRPFVGAGPAGKAVKDLIEAQYAARDAPYRALATLIVDASAGIEPVVAEISSALGRRESRMPPES